MRERGMLFALVIIMFWIGLFPSTFFDKIEEPVNYVVRKVDPTYFDPPALPGTPAERAPAHVAEATR
jgi:NADH:ubiquinone oxidoreductase subunit 4 (subunit M)